MGQNDPKPAPDTSRLENLQMGPKNQAHEFSRPKGTSKRSGFCFTRAQGVRIYKSLQTLATQTQILPENTMLAVRARDSERFDSKKYLECPNL